MLTLYHADTAVCAAKVRLVLAEKHLSYEGRLLDLSGGQQFSPEYMALNPNAVVPTLVHDGQVVTESTVISEYLDDAFPEIPLRPESAYGRARLHLWTKREDSIHDAINIMSAALIFRPALLEKSAEERAKRYEKIPDPARREKWRMILAQGLDAPYVRDALQRFARLFIDMQAALSAEPWLLGDAFTLADSGLVSFFFRLEMLQIDGMWRSHFPAVTRWFEACKARPSCDVAIRQPIPAAAFAMYQRVAGPERGRVEQQFAELLGTA